MALLHSHALLILAEVQKTIGVPGKVKLNIPQLALAKLAQREKHQTVTQEVPSFILTGGNDVLLSSM